MYLMGLDVGTTGCKAIIFDEEGRQLAYAYREYGIETDEYGKAEQDAELVWNLTKETMKESIHHAGTDSVKGISVSVQGDAVIPVSSNGKALGKAMLGMDYRPKEESAEAEKLLGAENLFTETGMRPHPLNSLIKIMYLKKKNHNMYIKSHKIVTYEDYILKKLGADWVIDYSMASRTMAFDLKKREWSSHILETVEIDRNKLSLPVKSGKKVGKLSAGLKEYLGLRGTCFLVTGGHDQPCAALGAGAIEEGKALSSTGTADVFSTTFQEPKLNNLMFSSYYPCYYHTAFPLYFTFSLNHIGGILFRWFRDNFCDMDVKEAATRSKNPYEYLLRRIPEKPTSLFFLPHLNGSGNPWCDLSSKGAIVGITMATTKYEIIKSILESLTFELALNIEKLEEVGIPILDIAAAGGGARAPQWLQIKANILNRPVHTLHCSEAACLGAAILAGVGTNTYHSISEGVKETVQYKNTFEPQSDFAEVYREKFAVYRDLYPALRTINKRI